MAWNKRPEHDLNMKPIRYRSAAEVHNTGPLRIGLVLFCAFWCLTGSAEAFIHKSDDPRLPPRSHFQTIWEDQSYLYAGLLGIRWVKETDMFVVRRFNPSGPNTSGELTRTMNTTHGVYPLFTLGGATHRNWFLVEHSLLTLHAFASAQLLYQNILIQSHLNQPSSQDDHFPIHHFNVPSVTTASLASGLWINEMLGAGVRLSWLHYRINTNDDRLHQRESSNHSLQAMPLVKGWIPLKGVGLPRWNSQITLFFDVAKRAHHMVPEAEIAFYKLSTTRTGRVTGLFVRFLSLPSANMGGNTGEFKIHHDKQVFAGVSIGTGGHNRRGGR